MSDVVRFDERTILVEGFGEVRALRLPVDPDAPRLSTCTIPFCEPCEGCGDPTGREPGTGLRFDGEGPCSSCWGTGRALFAWTDEPGPPLPVWVPPALAAGWLASRSPLPCYAAPPMPGWARGFGQGRAA